MRDDRPEGLDRPLASDRPEAADWPRQDLARSAADLGRRLDSLPDGHPSSRYESDGTPRESPVRLRDLDTTPDEDTPGPDLAPDAPGPEAHRRDDVGGPDESPPPTDTHPFTDTEWAEHITEVRTLLADAQEHGLSTLRQYAIDEDGEAWIPSRREVHGAIIEDLYAQSSNVPCEYKAIVAGGLAGAGKTTVLADYAGIDRSQYLTINPDDIKVEMAKRGLIPHVEGLSPMEASDLVHEESSHIAKQLAIRAQADGKNLIWDITMSTKVSAQGRIDSLRGAGYSTIRGIFVDIPIDVSATRADARHRQDQDSFKAGDGLGGRYVPDEIITAQADPTWGSQNRRAFEEVKSCFDQWTQFDNGVDGRDPVLAGMGPNDDPEEVPS